MRALHFDCFSGISGDMTVGALIDAGADAGAVADAVASLGLPVTVATERVNRAGFAATRFVVNAPPEHAHRHLPEIEAILRRGAFSETARDLAIRIFRRLGEAEAKVHGIALDAVHFHEVGALDSIADIAAAAVALDAIGAEKVTASPVVVGSGTVKGAHGVMPVPTPATMELLKGVPLADCAIRAELTTPTGAAILTTVVSGYSPVPPLTVSSIGYGAGTRDFATQPNVLRVLVGDAPTPCQWETDFVIVLETNLDDVSGEVLGYCQERLFHAGALDVYLVPALMKKGRPGTILGVIATPTKADELEAIVFRETATFGVRRTTWSRHKRPRESVRVETLWGELSAKRGGDVTTPEYEDCARVAREKNIPLREVYRAVEDK